MPRSPSPAAGPRGSLASLAAAAALACLLASPRPAGAQAYYWRDDQGSLHSAERLVDVPAAYREQALETRRRAAISLPDQGTEEEADDPLALPGPPEGPGGQASCREAVALFEDLAGRMRTITVAERLRALAEANRLCPSDRAIAFALRDALQREAEEAEGRKRHARAAEAYSSLLGLSPGSQKLLYSRGIALFRAGRYEEALEDIESLSDPGSPSYPLAPYALGMIAERQGRADEALEQLRKFVAGAGGRFPSEEDQAHRHLTELFDKRQEADTIAEVERGFTLAETPHFVIRWDPEDRDDRPRDLVEVVGRSLEQAYQQVGGDFGHFPTRKLDVVFYSPRAYAKRYKRACGANWEKAFFDRTDRSIRVKSTLETPKLLGSILTHEYTHAVVFDLAGGGGRLPSWINEGLAQIEARKLVYGASRALSPPPSVGEEVQTAIRKKSYLPLTDLQGWRFEKVTASELDTLDFPLKLRVAFHLAYREAYAATCLLVSRIGMTGVTRMLRELNGGADARMAFSRVYPAGLEAFEREFLASLDAR